MIFIDKRPNLRPLNIWALQNLSGPLLTVLPEDSDGENGDGPQQWRGSTPPNMLGRLRDHKPCYHPYLSLQFETLQTPARFNPHNLSSFPPTIWEGSGYKNIVNM